MKNTLLAIAIATISSTAFACGGPSCPASASVNLGGNFSGGASNSVKATSASVGNGSASSAANSGSYADAALKMTAPVVSSNTNGTASIDAKVEGSTHAGASASTDATKSGNGVAAAVAGGVAGAEETFGVSGHAQAGSTNAQFGFNGATASIAGAAAASGGVFPYSPASSVVNAGTAINAVGGVAVANCKDVASASGYFADSKAALTNATTSGAAIGAAVAGAEVGGTFSGQVH